MTKKIGVVTYVRTDNYGAELQGYALQQKLNMLGYDAECIDFDKIGIDKVTFREMAMKAIVNRFLKDPLHAIPTISKLVWVNIRGKFIKTSKDEGNKKIARQEAFEEFWKNAIRHSRYYTKDELYSETLNYDILIAGSDQIWNYTRTSFLDPYFLTFAKQGVKKLSYAASFSVSSIPNRLKQQYTELINGMDTIAVRENEGVEIVRNLTGKKAQLVIDPTLLLTPIDWLKVASDRIKFDFPYILTYSLNTSDGYWKIVNAHAKKYNLKVVNLRHDFHEDNQNPNRIDIFDAGPREFLYLLANARMVITNSFHGTIFSINFNVPFISVLNRISETNSRVTSILENLGLKNRLMYDTGDNTIKDSEMDFSICNNKLQEMRDFCTNFLTNSIEK